MEVFIVILQSSVSLKILDEDTLSDIEGGIAWWLGPAGAFAYGILAGYTDEKCMIAAMGGTPKQIVLSVAAPPHIDTEILDEIYKGINRFKFRKNTRRRFERLLWMGRKNRKIFSPSSSEFGYSSNVL